MIRVAGINGNDVVNGIGVSVSLFLQGCHFHCKGCHNPEAWDPNGGENWDWNDLINHIVELISANGIQRNLSILGGEPLDTYDKRDFIKLLLKVVKNHACADEVLLCAYSDANEFDIRELGGFRATPFCDSVLYWQSLRK